MLKYIEQNSTEEVKFFLFLSETKVQLLNPVSVHEIDEWKGDSISTDVLSSTTDKNLALAIESISGYNKFEVTIDAKIVNIVNDNDFLEYKSYSDNEIAHLSFCVAANMGNIVVDNDEVSSDTSSISYPRMLLNITISLSQGFETISVHIVELSPNK